MAKPSLHVVENEEPGLGKPLPVKLSRIDRFVGQPRRYFNDDDLSELADDIQINGQNTPVSVCKNSTKSGAFVLIGGERRWRAFHIIAKRTGNDPLVNCFIDTVNDERHHFRKAFRDNIRRKDLIAVDEAATYQRLYDESDAGSHSAKIIEIAKEAEKSKTHVENYLFLHKLPDSVKALMNPDLKKEQQLNTTSAIDIAKSTSDPVLQFTLAKEAIERQLGVTEVRTLIGVKTGKTGYGIGGRMRKPSDDYKAFKIFVGGTLNRLRRITKGIDIEALYENRDDDIGDRERDAALVREAVGHLNALLEKIDNYPKRSRS